MKRIKQIKPRTIVAILIILGLLLALVFATFRLSRGDDNGQRFDSIPNRISEQQMSQVLDRMNAEIGSIDSVRGEVMGATVYIRIDMAEGATPETARWAADHAYQILFEVLPIETYFSSIEGSMAYNIEIKAFDDLHAATFILQGIRSFRMDEPYWQNLMEPRNVDAANQAQSNQDARNAERARQLEEQQRAQEEQDNQEEPAQETQE